MMMQLLFLALPAMIGVYWLFRVRAAGRLRAAVDAYAEREIAQQAHWRARQKVRVPSTRKGVLAG
jgi:hypothetical protein